MDAISVKEAYGSMVQAQNVLKLMNKLASTLQFSGTVQFQDAKESPYSRANEFVVLFIPHDAKKDKRALSIRTNDVLFEDIYACVVVRVQEAGGVDKLPRAASSTRAISPYQKLDKSDGEDEGF